MAYPIPPKNNRQRTDIKRGVNPAYHTRRNRPYRYRFDFDIGYLVKSPCRTCPLKSTLPRCSDRCETLDRIHAALAESVSCSRRE